MLQFHPYPFTEWYYFFQRDIMIEDKDIPIHGKISNEICAVKRGGVQCVSCSDYQILEFKWHSLVYLTNALSFIEKV